MTKDDKLIKAALEVYRGQLAVGFHDHSSGISQASRDWAELIHDEVVELLERKYR